MAKREGGPVCHSTERALRAHGIGVPEDMGVAALDDTLDPDSEQRPPRPVAVQGGYATGRSTAGVLCACVATPGLEVRQRCAPARLLFGERVPGARKQEGG